MAKKKATMTLKDFHGGSIPSDLSLPSAPGVTVRPLNHAGFDCQPSWSNPMGRQDHRLRPGSAGAVRTYDNKTPFLTHNVQIGRNFDEDERKPLDGGSAPRWTVSDDNIHGSVPVRQEPRPDHPLARNAPLSQFPGGSTGGSYAARFSEAASASSGTGRSYVKSEVGSLGPSPNAWGTRKVAVGISESVTSSWSAPDAATKLAHASALEKVSSGRWLSNQHKQIDVEVIRHLEADAKIQSKGTTHATFSYGSARTSTHSDGVQVQPPHDGGSELTERPKLKLLPRSKPVDSVEPLVAYKQTTLQSGEPVTGNDTYGNVNYSVQDLVGPEDAHQASERARVNLKPRLQSLEQMERNTERERNALFGGARPRELVLKERGVDDVAVNHDMNQSPNRVKKDITRAENPPMNPTVTSRQNGKSEPMDHLRTGKTIDRRDAEKPDAQRRSNWRNENRKSSRDLDQQQERPPSPETWRKPVDPEPSVGPRYGKAASAVELAQAFTKSVSDPKVVATDRFSSHRGLPGQAQIPFSRLTSQPTTRSQINGQ
ncbi:hypothetical protein L1987_05341 [Smallanthus sonchifolius]|uniref:Uncharacterized protein n=1 Tax=Smallanthus sonchifolius TaxID=185202 RepID=A0ACB9JV39_9ASTR|nr:hypothetical protein L1987_05341 [Smallanthus sonchifolius]